MITSSSTSSFRATLDRSTLERRARNCMLQREWDLADAHEAGDRGDTDSQFIHMQRATDCLVEYKATIAQLNSTLSAQSRAE